MTRSCVEAALDAIDGFEEKDRANDVRALCSLAKAKASETLHLVSNEMVQMHGGIGMTDAHDAGLYMKRARVAEATVRRRQLPSRPLRQPDGFLIRRHICQAPLVIGRERWPTLDVLKNYALIRLRRRALDLSGVQARLRSGGDRHPRDAGDHSRGGAFRRPDRGGGHDGLSAQPVRQTRQAGCSRPYVLATMLGVLCVRREFNAWAADKSSPVVDWLRALARKAHADCGGRGVGAVGMCFTGNFALAMMTEPSMVAPVLSQPSLPIGKKKAAALGVSPDSRSPAPSAGSRRKTCR